MSVIQSHSAAQSSSLSTGSMCRPATLTWVTRKRMKVGALAASAIGRRGSPAGSARENNRARSGLRRACPMAGDIPRQERCGCCSAPQRAETVNRRGESLGRKGVAGIQSHSTQGYDCLHEVWLYGFASSGRPGSLELPELRSGPRTGSLPLTHHEAARAGEQFPVFLAYRAKRVK